MTGRLKLMRFSGAARPRGFFHTMEKILAIFPHNGKIFSTLWKTSAPRRMRQGLLLGGIALVLGAAPVRAANLINENIQSWTARTSYGTYTQTVPAGTVNMTRCIVSPGAAASA